LGNDADIIAHITSRIRKIKLKYRTYWAKAHQDDKRPYEELDMPG